MARSCARGGRRQVALAVLLRDVGRQRAERSRSIAASEARDLVAVHAVDPAESRACSRCRDRNRRDRPPSARRTSSPPSSRPWQVQPSVLRRLQAGIRDIAIDALLLVLLRAVGGDGQVAEIDVERRCGWPAPDRSSPRVSCRPTREPTFNGPLVAMSPVIRDRHGEVGGRRQPHRIDRPAPAIQRPHRGRDRRIACRIVEARYRPGHDGNGRARR